MTLANTVWAPDSHAATDESMLKHGQPANSASAAAAAVHAEENEQRAGQNVDPEIC